MCKNRFLLWVIMFFEYNYVSLYSYFESEVADFVGFPKESDATDPLPAFSANPENRGSTVI